MFRVKKRISELVIETKQNNLFEIISYFTRFNFVRLVTATMNESRMLIKVFTFISLIFVLLITGFVEQFYIHFKESEVI